jgi:SPW repeat
MKKRWLDGINILLGAWMFLSPWILGFADSRGPASWSAWVLGAAIFIFGLAAASYPGVWEEAVTLILGVLSLISPWLLGFGSAATPVTNAVVVGLLVMGFAVAATLSDPATRARLHLPRHTP